MHGTVDESSRTPTIKATVQYLKYPDLLHWRHDLSHLGADEHGIWLGGPAGTVVQRGSEPPISLRYPFVQLIAAGRWWSFIFNGDDHPKFTHYVDIITPSRWESPGRVTMIDLDLDVVRPAAGNVFVDDEDEFLDHQVTLGYPDWMVDKARTTAAELVLAVEHQRGPFGEPARTWFSRIAG